MRFEPICSPELYTRSERRNRKDSYRPEGPLWRTRERAPARAIPRQRVPEPRIGMPQETDGVARRAPPVAC
eukprot:10605581-Alexandrium_andersonii.AAC.4